MKLVIAPDKFKGSLQAREAAQAIARGIRQALPSADLCLKPIADGGEGFVRALARTFTRAKVHDPLGRPVLAEYGWLDQTTAVIEMSAASGLWRVSPDHRNPLQSSTFGTGQLIADAVAEGAKRILVGIGGSATNDGGAGMAAALGYQFLDPSGQPLLPVPSDFNRIAAIVPPQERDWPTMVAACDVDNPLLGARGATRVYGPQKGALDSDLELLEAGLSHLADLVSRDLGCEVQNVPGAGAAGGLGFGLMSFCKATIRPGFELVADALDLEKSIAGCDWVITGEGKVDAQTFQGKGPAGVASLARRYGKPVVVFAGICEDVPEVQAQKVLILPIAPAGTPLEDSIGNAAMFLENAAFEFASRVLVSA